MIQSNDETNQISKAVTDTKPYHAPKLTLLGPIHAIVQNGVGVGGDGAVDPASTLSVGQKNVGLGFSKPW
jgi:hypothetical protein